MTSPRDDLPPGFVITVGPFADPKVAAYASQAATHPSEAGLATRVGGHASIVGGDVGHLPGPSTEPMTQSHAPSSGKRGPTAPDAKVIAQQIAKNLRGRTPSSPVPGVPAGKATAPKAPATHPDRDRVELVLKAAGAPPSLVGDDSVLWHAAAEKVAATAPADEDMALVIERDDTHPFALWTRLGARYGDDWLGWDLEVVEQTLREDLGREPSTATMNKIAALQIASMRPDSVYGDWHVFEKVAVAFDGHAPRLTLVEDLSPEQMSFAASVMRMLAGSAAGAHVYARDLQKYCAARLFEAGFVVAPPELGFCDAELAKLAGSAAADLRQRTLALYAAALQGQEPRDIDQDHPPAEFVQAARLMRIHAYALDKLDDLVPQAL